MGGFSWGPQNGAYKALKGNSNSKVLELFRGLLGAFLGLLRLSWEASGSQKPKKTNGFLRFLKMQLFGSLRLLMALLGSSCPLFGRSGPKMGPKMVTKSGPKSDEKVGQNGPQNGPQKVRIFDQFDREISLRRFRFSEIFRDGAFYKTLTSKMPSRWPKNGPKMTPKWFKIAQIAQDSPKNKAL